MYQFIEIKLMNCEEAVSLCEQEYIAQQQRNKSMPQWNQEMGKSLRGIIEYAQNAAYGKAILYEGKLTGFLAFFGPWDGFHGVARGVFSPLGASAFSGEDRGKTASLLVAAVAEELVKEKIFSIAMSRYAGDEEVNRSLCFNSFGIRCSDAVMLLEEYEFSRKNQELHIIELKGDEKIQIKPLYAELIKHLAKGPCFFPTPVGQLDRWFENTESRLIAAKCGNQVVGYMALDENAENFLTERKDMYNICGAFVLEEYRALGVAKQILDTIVEICIKEGKSYLGVDYETMNPTALRFWTKYFEPYTYSFIRRIDERI